MNTQGYSARSFLIWSAVALVVFSGIVGVAAIWPLLPWGGADEVVREALPPAQGQTSAPD